MPKLLKFIPLLILFLSTTLLAEEVEIKGLKVGLTFEQVSNIKGLELVKRDIEPNSVPYALRDIKYDVINKEYYFNTTNYTIAGNNVLNVGFFFENNQVDLLDYTLLPSTFDDIIKELKNKYPNMICSYSELQNGYGAVYKQNSCTLKTKDSTLLAVKYFPFNLERGSIKIISNKSLRNYEEFLKKSKNDL